MTVHASTTDAEIADFVTRLQAGPIVGLSREDRSIIVHLLETILQQSATIAYLTDELVVAGAFTAIRDKRVQDACSSLRGVPVAQNSFTVKEATEQAERLVTDARSQANLVGILTTVAKFAIKYTTV